MKKVFKFALVALATAAVAVACNKPAADPTPTPKPDPDPDPQPEEVVPVEGNSAWSVIGTVLGTNWDKDYVCAEENGIFVLKNVELAATTEFKFRKDKGWDVNFGGTFESKNNGFVVKQDGDNIKPGLEGVYDLYLNVEAAQAAVCAKGLAPEWVKNDNPDPQPGEGREGKVLKLTPVISENAIFEKEEYADLGNGATFEIKFFANSWKQDGNCDRLACFENYDESPSMLIRFSNDGTQPGQLRFNNNAWAVGGGDGVKLTDADGNPYVFEAQKWHVLTMVLKPGEENAVSVDFYDNGKFINTATGKKNDKVFNFRRFEFGMSWEYDFNNDTYPLWQLFDGYIDYARVWTRELAPSEIAAGLCDVAANSEGLLVYWIMNEGDETGIVPNKAGDTAYNVDWSKMSEMNGGDFRKNLDLKADFLNALEEIDTPLCEF